MVGFILKPFINVLSTFAPKINNNASRLAPRSVTGDTNELLYRDSFARKQKQKEYQEIVFF